MTHWRETTQIVDRIVSVADSGRWPPWAEGILHQVQAGPAPGHLRDREHAHHAD